MTGPRNSKGRLKGVLQSMATSEGADAKSTGLVPSEIEYLLHQSTQGVHLMFDNKEIAKIMQTPTNPDKNPDMNQGQSGDRAEFFTTDNMEKVQSILTAFLDKPTLAEKKVYLGCLPREDYELLVRAYFQLVDNAILAHSNQRH